METIEIRSSRKQGANLVAIGLASILAFVLGRGRLAVFWELGVLGGVVSLGWGGYLLFDRSVKIELSSHAFTDHRLTTGPLPWSAVVEAWPQGGRRPTFLYIRTISDLWGGPERLAIRADDLDVAPRVLSELINERAEATKQP